MSVVSTAIPAKRWKFLMKERETSRPGLSVVMGRGGMGD
jgi:hypothetical protein